MVGVGGPRGPRCRNHNFYCQPLHRYMLRFESFCLSPTLTVMMLKSVEFCRSVLSNPSDSHFPLLLGSSPKPCAACLLERALLINGGEGGGTS